MSTNGILDFQNTNKVIFRGTDSNVVVDTSNASIGIGIQGTEKPGSNLHVIGDASISSNLKLTTDTSITVNSNVVTDFNGPHAREPKEVPLKKYPEIAFEEGKFDGSRTNTDATYDEQYYLQAGTTIKVVSETTSRVAHQAFNGDIVAANDNGWHTQFGFDRNTGSYDTSNDRGDTFTDTNGDPHLGMWIQTKFPNKIKVKNINLYIGNNLYRYPKSLVVLGHSSLSSLTGWTLLHTDTNISTTTPAVGDTTPTVLNVNADTAFDCYTILVKSARPEGVSGQQSVWVSEIEYYGYEEDPPAGDTSVDTTFTSIMNTPQTTGANVYVDGNLGETFTNRVVGPTVSNTHTTYVSAGKYWNLTGELTSNISVEANTFLEGDAPHSVSVWFNSSNLEANTANTCVFSISDQEKLDSQNLDLQSNTWHNLTYAYQGEGGSRVTYLDGRKVSEDQAEDTFGEYPPFAMTGYSQDGYVVSSAGGSDPWKAFNNTTTDNNDRYFGLYDVTTSYYTTGTGYFNTTGYPNLKLSVSSGTPAGDWIAIEMPYKLKLDTLYLKTRSLSSGNSSSQRLNGPKGEAPRDFEIWGTNDDVNWYLVKAIIDAEAPNTKDAVGEGCADPRLFAINATKSYKKFAMIVTRNGSTYSGATAASYITVGEMSFYGHRENDLVRLPDPTNVLKYPHIAMTGPAQRGYVASASDTHNTIITNNGGPWQAFDGTITQVTTEGWVSPNSRYSNDAAGSTAVNGVANSFNGRDGEWLNIKLPHKITLSSFETFVRIDRDHEHPTSGYLYASNDGFATFQEIYSFTDVAVPGEVNGKVTHVIPSSHLSVNLIPYNEYRIQATKLEGAAGFVSIAELKLYGTEEDTSVPIQIGGGNIDKVANFRVYDKFIDENQALEIWDAQKDAFGRAKSSMTLHKGRLGIGTTEPEGRLAVVDEPDPDAYGLQEFPPKPLTSNDDTHIEGHGIFKISASSYRTASWSRGLVDLFDKDTLTFVHNSNGSAAHEYSTSDGTYTGTASLGEYSGEWYTIKLPYRILINHFTLRSRGENTTDRFNQSPKDFTFVASNDGGRTWVSLSELVNQNVYASQASRFNINTNVYYDYFGFIVHKIQCVNISGNADGTDALTIAEWKLFGTREQVTKQSVLHDGQLTLTKNLTVPRIGPALDADDTPRRDRLVVEYNTSTNPTFEGAVRDTSGRGNDAVFRGSASYDATEKAFNLTNHDKDLVVVRDNISGVSGDILGTISLWFKTNDTTQQAGMTMFQIGHANTTGDKLALFLYEDDVYMGWGGANYVYAPSGDVVAGKWTHVVGIKKGTGAVGNGTTQSGHTTVLELYIDGVKKTVTNWDGTDTLNITKENQIITVGAGSQDSTTRNNGFDGYISNVKFWGGVVLTAEEVKTLYDMGRCDEGHHMVNFSKTRVGIGLGDGEAPRGALDVRGDIYGGCPVLFKVNIETPGNTTLNSSTTNPVIWNRVSWNKGGGYNPSNGKFTAPITGYYSFNHWAMSQGNDDIIFKYMVNGLASNDLNPIRNEPYQTPTGNHAQNSGTTTFKLRKGDYVELFLSGGSMFVSATGSAMYNSYEGYYLSSW